ncbi:HAD-IIIA family hydrolase [candidate division KSB1 bacterium]|nr:HAD-IIIA family hydrolase [candidate division KSB1 bacterium]
MVIAADNFNSARHKAKKIKLLLTDCDGVLTDGGVYYSDRGEEMKRFNIRDGMGVARLRALAKIDVGIITGELSGSVAKRAEKLEIVELHLGAKDKIAILEEIMQRRNLKPEEIAYIGDDTNDVAVMKIAGLSACPADALHFARDVADYVCRNKGGHGAFRDFAEFLIEAKNAM